MKKYTGSCHCGKVRFIAEMDLSKGTGRCNCSICAKGRLWSVIVKPSAFNLVQGHGDLTTYRFNTKQTDHFFCKTCGIKPFIKGDIPEVGGAFVSISVSCLDNVEPEELAAAPVGYSDGLHDNWMNPPKVTSYL